MGWTVPKCREKKIWRGVSVFFKLLQGSIFISVYLFCFLLVKRQDSADNWLLFDNKRNTSNPTNLALSPNNTAAESVGNLGNGITLQSTGFQLATTDGGLNDNNGVYLYFAIKEN